MLFSADGANREGVQATWSKGKKGAAWDRTAIQARTGICASITLRWIRQVMNGKSILSMSDVGSEHHMALAYGAARFSGRNGGKTGRDSDFDVYGLKPLQTTVLELKSYQHLLSYLIRSDRGLYYVSLHAFGENIGHAIGFRLAPGNINRYSFLDANSGLYLYKFAERREFEEDVSAYLAKWYSEFLFGEYTICKMGEE